MAAKRKRGPSPRPTSLATWRTTHFAGVPRIAPRSDRSRTLTDSGVSVEVRPIEGDLDLDALRLDCPEARRVLAYPEHDDNPICDFALLWTRRDRSRVSLALAEFKGGLADDVVKDAHEQLDAVYRLLRARLDAEAARVDWYLVVVAFKARSKQSEQLDRQWSPRIGRGLIHVQVPRGRFDNRVNLRHEIAAAPTVA